MSSHCLSVGFNFSRETIIVRSESKIITSLSSRYTSFTGLDTSVLINKTFGIAQREAEFICYDLHDSPSSVLNRYSQSQSPPPIYNQILYWCFTSCKGNRFSLSGVDSIWHLWCNTLTVNLSLLVWIDTNIWVSVCVEHLNNQADDYFFQVAGGHMRILCTGHKMTFRDHMNANIKL